jgi:hypothetical protein
MEAGPWNSLGNDREEMKMSCTDYADFYGEKIKYEKCLETQTQVFLWFWLILFGLTDFVSVRQIFMVCQTECLTIFFNFQEIWILQQNSELHLSNRIKSYSDRNIGTFVYWRINFDSTAQNFSLACDFNKLLLIMVAISTLTRSAFASCYFLLFFFQNLKALNI